MEAPEKLYFGESDKGILDIYSGRESDDEIEYTRTDAFIDKAVDYIANKMRCDGYTFQTKAKFIKDFKSYMKGE